MSRRVLITGGTRGIGHAIAIAFKNNGDKVAATYHGNNEAAQAFEKETGIKVFKWDVASFEECKQNIPLVDVYLGGNVEVLVNNAGITKDAVMHKQSFENWLAVINTNLNSVFNMSRCVIEAMRNAKFGRIINISSVNANGMFGQTNYSAAKAGVEGFTKALALESARVGVTVNAIAPGYIGTDMVAGMPPEALSKMVEKVPMNRLGKVEEISATAVFLASEGASFITGAVIAVNG
ncbi:MAG: 3-oxoacyl-ACP reductase, partial [Proteobacteria bacterium]|nr:3-oxoacyl-ACP reductase [Pseudomonadota bacterium]